jgi:hypothetical protein
MQQYHVIIYGRLKKKMIYFQIFFTLNIFELFVTKNIEPNSLILYGDNLQLFARRNHGNTSVGYIVLVIKDWDFNMKRKDGEEYMENVVKTMWNITAKKFFFNDPFKDILLPVCRKTPERKKQLHGFRVNVS